EFSYAYIYAVVSAAGYSFQIANRPLDIGGIDIIISGEEQEYSLYPPRLEGEHPNFAKIKEVRLFARNTRE
ncbi:MAG: hypothetical protein AAFR83_23035, partial [Cyanobacteria bacterium J06629_18]